MKKSKRLGLLLTVSLGTFITPNGPAQSLPGLISYPGKLTHNTGNPLPNNPLKNSRTIQMFAQPVPPCDSPTIHQQPQSRTNITDSMAVFSVAATGTNLSYQWRFRGTNLVDGDCFFILVCGVNESTLEILDVQEASSGDYSVIVSNTCGIVVSSNATLTVLPPQPPRVNFSNKAGDSTLGCPGAVWAPVYLVDPHAPFLRMAGNTPMGIPPGTIHYGGGFVTGSNYTAQLWAGWQGALEHDLIPIATTTFRSSDTPSEGGTLIPLDPPPVVPFVPVGGHATFQLRVWYNAHGRITNWSQIQEYPCMLRAMSPLFTPDCPLGDGIEVPIPNLQGLVSFNLSQNDLFISRHPQSQTNYAGTDITFSVAAQIFGCPELTYQWQFNQQNLDGATNQTLTLGSVTSAHAGRYRCIVTALSGTAESQEATLTVIEPPVLAEPGRLADVSFRATIFGEAGQQYIIEASSNLTHWLPVATNVLGTGPWIFVDSSATNTPHFFYRVALKCPKP